jgi:hypothetical protein
VSGAPVSSPQVDRKLPPVTVTAMASMGLVIVSGIYLASHLPERAALGPSVGLLAASAAVFLAALVMVSRVRPFAWEVFFRVAGWALLAYLVIGGMLEFVFVFDHTRGSMLAVLSLSLVLFALNVPLLLAFTVARYQAVDSAER